MSQKNLQKLTQKIRQTLSKKSPKDQPKIKPKIIQKSNKYDRIDSTMLKIIQKPQNQVNVFCWFSWVMQTNIRYNIKGHAYWTTKMRLGHVLTCFRLTECRPARLMTDLFLQHHRFFGYCIWVIKNRWHLYLT